MWKSDGWQQQRSGGRKKKTSAKGQRGAVLWFDPGKGYGFIKPLGPPSPDVFVHAVDIKATLCERPVLITGEYVQFQLGLVASCRHVELFDLFDERDELQIVGVRADGSRVTPPGMSEGTRDGSRALLLVSSQATTLPLCSSAHRWSLR